LKIFESGKIYNTNELARNSTAFLDPDQKEFVLRTTKSKRLFILIISHAFAAAIILGDPSIFLNSFSHFSVITLFYGFFTFVALPVAWYHYFDNKPKLTISYEGIWTPDEGLYTWGMITQTSIKEESCDGQKYYLILNVSYGNGEPEEIKSEVTYLDKKPEVISHIIEKLKLKVLPPNVWVDK
jgi:hypothetical protein